MVKGSVKVEDLAYLIKKSRFLSRDEKLLITRSPVEEERLREKIQNLYDGYVNRRPLQPEGLTSQDKFYIEGYILNEKNKKNGTYQAAELHYARLINR